MALKWSLRPYVTDSDLLEGVHVSISSLIRASTGLFRNVAAFIAGFAAFDEPSPDSVAEVEF